MICGDLHELTNGLKSGRLSQQEITLFKSVGPQSKILRLRIFLHEKYNGFEKTRDRVLALMCAFMPGCRL